MGLFELLFFLSLFPAAIMLIAIVQVNSMKTPEKNLMRNDSHVDTIIKRLKRENLTWIEGMDLQYYRSYNFGQIIFSVWKFPGRPTHLIIYLARGKLIFDIGTDLPDDKGLITTNSRDSNIFPLREGDFKEALDRQFLGDLFLCHEQSLEYLKSLGYEAVVEPFEFEENLIRGMKKEMQHVQSIPLYPVRFLYWFLIRKRLFWNKTIAEQSDKRPSH